MADTQKRPSEGPVDLRQTKARVDKINAKLQKLLKSEQIDPALRDRVGRLLNRLSNMTEQFETIRTKWGPVATASAQVALKLQQLEQQRAQIQRAQTEVESRRHTAQDELERNKAFSDRLGEESVQRLQDFFEVQETLRKTYDTLYRVMSKIDFLTHREGYTNSILQHTESLQLAANEAAAAVAGGDVDEEEGDGGNGGAAAAAGGDGNGGGVMSDTGMSD